MEVDPAQGSIDISHCQRQIITSAMAEVIYYLGAERHEFRLTGDVAYAVAEDKVRLIARDGSVELTWQVSVVRGDIEATLQVTNVGSRRAQLIGLCPLVVSRQDGGGLLLGASPDNWTFYQNGWQSWSPTFGRHLLGEPFAIPPDEEYAAKHLPHVELQTPETLVSQWFTVLCDRDSRTSLLLGFTAAKDQLTDVRLRLDAGRFVHLAAVCHGDGVALAPGDSLVSEPLLIVVGHEPQSLLELYGTSMAQAMAAPRTMETQSGWCSWYHFYGENTAQDVLANLDVVERQNLPLEIMLIDDGYQGEIGDWLKADRAKFPQGMRWLADRIRDAGLRPGLWVAPFAVSSLSQLYAEHPDWVLRSEGGEPIVAWHHWAVPVYGLDVSHPEVQGWLRGLFRVLSQDWGYDFFKLDFLYAGVLAGKRHDVQITRAQALRRGLKAIREAVGGKFLLSCGCPMGPAAGLVDAMRIGPDVATYWRYFKRDLSAAAVENALRNTLTRSFMHRRLWINDPDCVLVRSREQESDLTLNEVRTLVTVVGLCGGMVMSGDDLASLDPSRLRYLKAILPPYGESAVPVDLFDNELPHLLSLPIESSHGRSLIGAVMNWKDRTVQTTIDLTALGLQAGQDYHAYDYWHRRYLGKVRDRLVVRRHQPHETVVLLFRPVSNSPKLLTSTFHLTQGAVEVRSVTREAVAPDGQRLVVQVEKQGSQSGQLLFTVPEPYAVTDARVNRRRRSVNYVAPGVASVGFHLQDRARVEICFSGEEDSGRERSLGTAPDEKVVAVHRRLLQEYGHHRWIPHRDPLSELVRTILSQNTSDINSDRAFARLRENFPSWEAVRDGDPQQVTEAIKPGGLGGIKAPRIQGALRSITEERGDLDLDFLRGMEVDQARAWLQSLVGVGPKTAACVLLFSLGRPVLPVDTHVLRVSRRLGLIEPRLSAERAHEVLGRMLADDAVYDFHVNMVSHGRQVCHARRPRCEVCVLAPHCDYYHRGR